MMCGKHAKSKAPSAFVLKDDNMYKLGPKTSASRWLEEQLLRRQEPDEEPEQPPVEDDDEPEVPEDEDLPTEEDPEDPPTEDEPDDEEPVPTPDKDRKCAWGPSHYCQSEEVFSSCGVEGSFESKCGEMRAGMLNKCDDLGPKFWCSNITNFNYCVKSQGFEGQMSDFEACKPSIIDKNKKCRRCGRHVTKIYNIHACACDKK